jgi:DNA-binding response OmpR family regulator
MPNRSTVLAVDDNEAYCYIVCRGLERHGFRTLQAHTGTDTLRVAAEQHPSAVVLDVNLPDFDGYEVCRRLKANADTRTIPVIFLSATYQSNHARERGIAAGADAFLFAPIEPDQLAMVVSGSLMRAANRA